LIIEASVTAAKATVLDYHSEWRRYPIILAEQGIIGGDAICTEKHDGKSRRPMFVVECPITFQYLHESKWVRPYCGKMVCGEFFR
jgi:hypothetical protein